MKKCTNYNKKLLIFICLNKTKMKLASILYMKFCRRIENTTFLNKIFLLYKMFFVASIVLIAISPTTAFYLIEYENFVIPKIFIGLNFGIFIEDIIVFLKRFTLQNIPKLQNAVRIVTQKNLSNEKTPTLYGLPLEDIVALLVEKSSWKTVDFHRYFGKKNNLFKQIGDFLEKRGILERGEKNQRVLKVGLSMENIIDQIQLPSIEKKSENYYNYNG